MQIIADRMMDATLFSIVGFFLAMVLTPIYTYFAYKYKFWKRQRSAAVTGEKLEVFNKLHAKKMQRNIPTMAGLIGVLTVIIITVAFNLNREQTWLPLAALAGGAALGLIDDILNVWGHDIKNAGLRAPVKFALIIGLGLVLGWFFYYKLGHTDLWIPYIGTFNLGWLMIPLFAFAVVASGNAVNISDGLDGLAGGLLIMSYNAFGLISPLQGRLSLAAFCFTALGTLLAYVWFNVYPARFFMGDVGSFAWGTALGVVAMLTDSLLLLPVIGFLFVVEAGSSLIQIISKKFFGRKIFISAPIHHHLEAKGWEETKITMRFWVIAAVTAAIGVMMAMAARV